MASAIEAAAREYVRIFNASVKRAPTASIAIAVGKAEDAIVRAVGAADHANDGGELDVYRTAARDFYGRDGEIEIDDDAVVSIGEDGAYVAAWVFIQSDATDDTV